MIVQPLAKRSNALRQNKKLSLGCLASTIPHPYMKVTTYNFSKFNRNKTSIIITSLKKLVLIKLKPNKTLVC